MQAFEAPKTDDDDIDPAAAKPGILVVVGGVAMLVAGMVGFTQGLQLWAMFEFYNWMFILPYVFMVLGMVQMALGATASAGRDWAMIAAALLTWFVQLIALGFFVWTLMHGLIPLTWVWCGFNAIASLLAPIAIPGALSASRARRALYR